MSRKSRRDAGKREQRFKAAKEANRRRVAARRAVRPHPPIDLVPWDLYPPLTVEALTTPGLAARLPGASVFDLEAEKPSREAVLILTKRALEAAYPERADDLMRSIELGWNETGFSLLPPRAFDQHGNEVTDGRP